jgi:acyl carrier protein
MSVKDKIYEVVAKRMKRNIADLTDETNLKKDLNADSIDTVEIIFEIEEEYEIDIDDKYAEQINTISDAIRVVEEIISENG